MVEESAQCPNAPGWGLLDREQEPVDLLAHRPGYERRRLDFRFVEHGREPAHDLCVQLLEPVRRHAASFVSLLEHSVDRLERPLR